MNKEENGLSAQEVSDTHVCRKCFAFRPAKLTAVCGGYEINIPAYCAFMMTDFCMGKRCKQYLEQEEK